MNTNTLLVSAALLLGSALPAAADHGPGEYVPSHYAVQVDELLPQSGAPGSLVTVRGRGLHQVQYVLVGGYKATAQHAGGQELTFRIPQQHGDGMIELYVPGRGNVAVGRFTVFSMLAVEGFSPRSGKAGTQVEIRGQGFQHGDQVLMGDRLLPVLHVDSSRIVVRIPGNASSDHFTIIRQGGVSERTGQRFHVMADQPIISSVTPQSGLPGTEVRIAGHGFDQSCKVFYGQEKLPVLRYRGGSIDARIPHYAEHDEYLYVNCAGEQGRSPYRFQLAHQGGHHAIEIRRVSPGRVRAGDTVTLRGAGFDQHTRVFWGRHELRVIGISRNGKRMEVLAPGHARGTQYLYVDGGAGRVQTGASLEIVPQRRYSYRGELRAGSDGGH